MPRDIIYWVMCERDVRPEKVVVSSFLEFVEELERLVLQRGPVEWMNRA